MLLSYSALGIELGDGALKAVKLRRRGSRLVVTWADYRPYARAEDGSVRPRAGVNPRALETLRQFISDVGPGALDHVFVGMPSVATFNRLIKVPDVGAERLREIAHYEAHRSLRGTIDDYLIQTRILKGQAGQDEIPCLLFAVRKTLLDAFVTDLATAGLEFDSLIPSPTALASFVRYDRPAQGDRIAVSVGLRATEIVFLRDRGHTFRTLPLGVVGLESHGTDPTQRSRAARLLVGRITAEIDKGRKFFFPTQGDFNPGLVTLFGEGAAMTEVVAEFRNVYGDLVEEVGSLHRIAIDASVPVALRPRIAQMGSALGLAIAAQQKADGPIPLTPENRSRKAARRLPGLAAAGLALSLGTFLVARHDITEAERSGQIRVVPKAETIRSRTSEEQRLQAEHESLEKRELGLEEFARERAPRTNLLAAIVRHFGPEITDFGPADFRLLKCSIRQVEGGTEVTGRTRAPLVDPRAATVLRQRLGSVSGLSQINVTELEDERDEFLETTVLSFSARLTAGGRR